ncbi:MAG: hypothetical protein Q4D71_07785 [Oscillospiraceae bacterium]|nr:hypothetical protein [Oscillospiraceae bacterium]
MKSLICFFIALGCIVSVNIWGDPANLMQNEAFYDRMLDVMKQGYNIEHVADFRDRVFQQRAAKAIDKPETIIFGSSRVQQIDTVICGTTTWNAGVSGATTQDICGLYQVFRENSKIGDRVIIGIDLWTLDGEYYDARSSIYLSKPLARFMTDIAGIPTKAGYGYNRIWSDFNELTSLSYFQSSVNYLKTYNGQGRMRDLITSTEPYSNYGMLKFDGSYTYPNNYIYVNQNVVEERVGAATATVVDPIVYWKGIDPDLKHMFESLCNDIVSNGSELFLIISPIHPLAYYEIQKGGGEIHLQEIESYLHSYADSIGATVLGSFDPWANYCDYSDFMDALHVTPMTTERLWKDALTA